MVASEKCHVQELSAIARVVQQVASCIDYTQLLALQGGNSD
jgi:hypothetical protein